MPASPPNLRANIKTWGAQKTSDSVLHGLMIILCLLLWLNYTGGRQGGRGGGQGGRNKRREGGREAWNTCVAFPSSHVAHASTPSYKEGNDQKRAS